MKDVSKLLIAYDGSACADAAIDDLGRAGLPSTLEALVITVADVILPPPDDVLKDDMPAIRIPEVERHAQERAQKALKDAHAFADGGAARVGETFPGWDVKTEGSCDSPAWAILNVAARENSDLIIVGAHGHSVAGGRLILGSVSQRVLYEAQTSVRVARCWKEGGGNGPIRIVIGFTGGRDSEVAVDAVASRSWPFGSEARLVTASQVLTPEARAAAFEKLLTSGLALSDISRAGDPAHVLISEAEEWGADSIFVGTRDLHGFQHLLHGSVSSAVAARARCSVEVSRAVRDENI